MLEEYQHRNGIHASMDAWSRHCGFVPAKHHQVLNQVLEDIDSKGGQRVIVCMPPGSAKSTYLSKLFPGWFLRKKDRCILACSYAYDLIQGFGKEARNIAAANSRFLGYSIRGDSKAAGEWSTSNGGKYFCAGVGSGIAGHRADLGFIDDPIGLEQDARSPKFLEDLYRWYWNDFTPRLRDENASVMILANRRGIEDLVGQLIKKDGARWKVIKMPLVIETPRQEQEDVLGRKMGEMLWPERFGKVKLHEARMSEDFNGLYQQEPVAPGGNRIKAANLIEYFDYNEVPKDLRIYVGSDHALTTKEENDASCLIPAGIDSNGEMWILPDVWWDRKETDVLVQEMLKLGKRRQPLEWFAEDEMIRKSIGPFLKQEMKDQGVWINFNPLPSCRDLETRSASIRAMIGNNRVHFPAMQPWWRAAKDELLAWPNGTHDDFLAALAQLGRGLTSIIRPQEPKTDPADPLHSIARAPGTYGITLASLKAAHRAQMQHSRYGGR